MIVFSLGSPILLVVLAAAPCGGAAAATPGAAIVSVSMRYTPATGPPAYGCSAATAMRKLGRLTKLPPWLMDQLLTLYDRRGPWACWARVLAFRAMHLHGHPTLLLLPAVDHLLTRASTWTASSLQEWPGWNFGDGHLHDEGRCGPMQEQCDFAEGELRCVFRRDRSRSPGLRGGGSPMPDR